MKSEFFVDSSGFYALLSKEDTAHAKAKRMVKEAAQKLSGFVTTDYIIDETATLLMARGLKSATEGFFEMFHSSKVCRVEWMDPNRFTLTSGMFLKHRDHSYSFTDCFSFVVMKELKLQNSLTKDKHFREAGFTSLL